MSEPGPFCYRCNLPLFMCAHRGRAVAPRRGVDELAVDWDHVEELAAMAAEREVGPVTEAGYARPCPGCAGPVAEGEMIYFSTLEGRYVCSGCAGDGE